MKKTLAILLAVFMVLGACLIPVSAATEAPVSVPEAFFTYDGSTEGAIEINTPAGLTGWTATQTVTISAATGKVGLAQLTDSTDYWETGVIFDVATGMFSAQIDSVTVNQSEPVVVSGTMQFAVTFDGESESVYVNGVLAATVTGFDPIFAEYYLAPAYVCAVGCYNDSLSPAAFETFTGITTDELKIYAGALTADQIASIFEAAGLGSSNYGEVISAVNAWYNVDCTGAASAKSQVIDMASIGANIVFPEGGYTKVTTYQIPAGTYAAGSKIGVAQIRNSVANTYFTGFAYDLGTGVVSLPYAVRGGNNWWTITYTNESAAPMTGNVQFIETLDAQGNLNIYANGVLMLTANATDIVETNEDGTITHDSIMRFIRQEDANTILLLGDYRDGTDSYDVTYSLQSEGSYHVWNASYPINSFTEYGVSVLSAKGYKLAATADAIADFYQGGAGVDSLNSVSNLSSLGAWYNDNYYDLSDMDNPVVGLTTALEYTYDNTGIDLANGYTKVAVYYIPENTMEANTGWIDLFADTPVVCLNAGEAIDGIRYDIASGLIRSENTTNFYRYGQTSYAVKATGYTVFTMTYDGHTARVWVNGQLAYYANELDAVPSNSAGYSYAASHMCGLGQGNKGLLLTNHTTATKNSFGDSGINAYLERGTMLAYDAGYTGVASDAAIAELTMQAAAIATTLNGTHVHKWSEWVTTVEPGCTTTGTAERTCSSCGKVETKVVAAVGHNWGAWVTVVEPTAETTGLKKRVCTVCGAEQTVVIEPLVSSVSFDSILGKAPYYYYDYSDESGLTEIETTWANCTATETFTNEVKVTVIKVPNYTYEAGSTIGIAFASTGDKGFDMGVVYDLGTGLVSPAGMFDNVVTQNAVLATGVIQFIEVNDGTNLLVYVNGQLALHATHTGTYTPSFLHGIYRYLNLNLAGDKNSNIFELYGAKTLYGAAYHDVDVTDAVITEIYKKSTPATEQIIAADIPAYNEITGVSNWKTNCDYLAAGGTTALAKDMRSGAISAELIKITAMFIPDVEYSGNPTVGIALLSTGSTNYDFSVKYNIQTGEVTPFDEAATCLETVETHSVKEVGYVQIIEAFDGVTLSVYVNGQLAYTATVKAENADAVAADFAGGAYRHLLLNYAGDGVSNAESGVKTMYFAGYKTTTVMSADNIAGLYDLFVDSISRKETAINPDPYPVPVPDCEHTHTEIRDQVDATCTVDGYTGDTYCTDCGEKIATGSVIPATGHIHTEIRGQVDATCTVDGYTGDTYCTDCDEKIETGSVIPATGHHYVDGVCDVCGDVQVLNGFITTDDGQIYYVDGVAQSGLFTVSGVKYYADPTTKIISKENVKVGSRYYTWDETLGMVYLNGFFETAAGTICCQDGKMVIGWRHADGTGPALFGDVYEQYTSNPNGLYYFLSTTGVMVTDATYTLGGYIREFNADHTVKPINGMQLKLGVKYYYIDGVRQVGWHTDDATGNTYYFLSTNAQAAAKWMTIGNQIYYFYASTSNPAYALKTSGSIGGITYNYAADGHILYNGFVNCDYANVNNKNSAAYIQYKNGTTRYYVNGVMQTKWQQIGGKWYYFYAIGSANGSGYMCCESRTIGGVWYEFTADGVCTNHP